MCDTAMVCLIQWGFVPRCYQRGHQIMVRTIVVIIIVDVINVFVIVPYYRQDQHAFVVPNNVCEFVMIIIGNIVNIILCVALPKLCYC